MNTAFFTEINAGSEYESMIFQSIANTIGYYNSNKVVLTINNQLYYSLRHILLKKWEHLTPNYNNFVQVY
jgi:hypothetical protein